jgi:hypothetical protein
VLSRYAPALSNTYTTSPNRPTVRFGFLASFDR